MNIIQRGLYQTCDMLRAASYIVVVVVKVYVGAYLIVKIISYLQVNSLLLFTSHDTIA